MQARDMQIQPTTIPENEFVYTEKRKHESVKNLCSFQSVSTRPKYSSILTQIKETL